MPETAVRKAVEPWLHPISSEAPGGADLRYEPEHEWIRNQAALLDMPTGGEIDWEGLVARAGDLLQRGSKDVLIASYLAYGLYATRGLEGLATGLWLVVELLDRYWEAAFPPRKRLRARANAVDWLTERACTALGQARVDDGDAAAVRALDAAAKRLAEVVGARFEESAPAMRPLLEAVERLALSVPGGEASPEPDRKPEPGPGDAAPPSPEPPAPAASGAAPPAQAPAPAEAAPAGSAAAPAQDVLGALRERVASLLEPVRAEAPGGEDLRYDPEHEGIRQRIAQLDAPTGGEVDWEAVEAEARALLSGRSKDLLIAAYFVAARFERDGLDGLAEGLAALAELMDGYWEQAFPPPKRLRARVQALGWLLERLEGLEDRQPAASERAAVERLEVAAGRFAEVTRARLGDEAPALRPLSERVGRLRMSLPAEEAPAAASGGRAGGAGGAEAPADGAPASEGAAAGAGPAEGAAPARPSAAPPAEVPDMPAAPAAELADAGEVKKFLGDVGKALQNAARLLFQASSADPTPYRLLRTALYLHLESPPPVTDGGKTRLPAPAPQVVQRLEAAAGNQRWDALLEAAESTLPAQRFWLDLHRYAVMALRQLGPSHAAAADAAQEATAALVRRMPALLERQFADGTPFASGSTREWLEGEVLGAPGSAPEAAAGGADGLDEALAAARKRAVEGDLQGAAQALAELERSGAARDRFRARLALADACAEGAPAVARGIYEALVAEVDRHHLESWEPELAKALYGSYHRLLSSKGARAGDTGSEHTWEIYSRLCRVAPAAAIKARG